VKQKTTIAVPANAIVENSLDAFYFFGGARDATIFSKRGSPRNGSHIAGRHLSTSATLQPINQIGEPISRTTLQGKFIRCCRDPLR
jgi:hypothetical protein